MLARKQCGQRKGVKARKPAVCWESPHFSVLEHKLGKDASSHSYFSCQRPSPNTVHILALTSYDEVVLVRQFRPPVNNEVVELPAGVCDRADEALIDAARRELLEETGYEAEEMELLFSGTVSPGLSNEIYNLFLATGVERSGEGGGVGHEKIQVLLKPRHRLLEFLVEESLEGSVLVDAKIPTALALAEKYLSPESIF